MNRDLSHLIERKQRLTRYPWRKMLVGDYLVVSAKAAETITGDLHRLTGLAFRTETTALGRVKITRVAAAETMDDCKTPAELLGYITSRHKPGPRLLNDLRAAFNRLKPTCQ